ncbi:putative AC transposase [Hypsizygus marmoreus]|uniref:AC transposase n=1 Tax=Hypsizygus marmoreus TaxID=39966 RepID=A0A369JHT3_HYPMA|nr:putative AC transposase [Hypsizygus marmoreus]
MSNFQDWHCNCGALSSLQCSCFPVQTPRYLPPPPPPSGMYHFGHGNIHEPPRFSASPAPFHYPGQDVYQPPLPHAQDYSDNGGQHTRWSSFSAPHASFQEFQQTPHNIYSGQYPVLTPPSQRPPLGNATGPVLNAPSPTPVNSRQKRKRQETDSSSTQRGAKRHNPGPASSSNAPSFSVSTPTAARVSQPASDSHSAGPLRPAVYGVGPASAPVPSTSTSMATGSPTPYGSILAKDPKPSNTAATDVWFCVVGVTSKEKPDVWPPVNEIPKREAPKMPFIACRLCSGDAWHAWKNTSGQTVAIREYLKRAHPVLFAEQVLTYQLKGWEQLSETSQESRAPGEREPFTLEGFYRRLVRWIAVDDQSINVVDCEELRDLLLYLGTQLEERDIPHRTKLSQLILQRFREEYDKLIAELKHTSSRVSFTTDLWTRQNQQSYMAVTAHWCFEAADGDVKMRSRLVAFRHVSGSHDGVNLAKVFVGILKELGICNKIGMVTLDNASNCNSMMREVSRMLKDMGIAFDVDGNRIRCFPHVVNLCVKAGLKQLTLVPSTEAPLPQLDSDEDINTLEAEVAEFLRILADDPIAAMRQLVIALRASGQRREDFEKAIMEGNAGKKFGEGVLLRVVVLLKDMDVRWSSTFLMIDRGIELYPAIKYFLGLERNAGLAHLALDDKQIEVLKEIRKFLHLPHMAQELVSSERTPTLPVVLPVYEKLIGLFKGMKTELPSISHGIDAAVSKLEAYLSKTRNTRVYVLALIINPTIKFQWIEKNWTREEVARTRKWVLEAMLEYKRSMRMEESRSTTAGVVRPLARSASAPNAARALQSGLARLHDIEAMFSARPQSAPPTETQSRELSAEEQDAEDKLAVEAELKEYIEEGVITNRKAIADLNLLFHWRSRKHTFKTLYRIALDVMPVQASSVPSERVFSSSKETDTLRRANLSPKMMEVLQILKYSFKQDRLDFSNDWIVREEELVSETPSSRAVNSEDLGQVGELAPTGSLNLTSIDSILQDSNDYFHSLVDNDLY